MDESVKKLNEKLESICLRIILTGLGDRSITVDEARHFSKAFLQTEPFNSIDEAKQKIYVYVQENPKFMSLKEYIDAYDEESHKDEKIEKMRELIKNNNIEEALSVAKA